MRLTQPLPSGRRRRSPWMADHVPGSRTAERLEDLGSGPQGPPRRKIPTACAVCADWVTYNNGFSGQDYRGRIQKCVLPNEASRGWPMTYLAPARLSASTTSVPDHKGHLGREYRRQAPSARIGLRTITGLAARGRTRRGSATQAKPPAPPSRINSLRLRWGRPSACRDFCHGLLA